MASHPTVCNNASEGHPEPNDPDQRLTAQTPEGLSEGKLSVTYKAQTPTILTSVTPDPRGATTDPLADVLVPGDCPVPAGQVPYSLSEPLEQSRLYVGLGSVTVPYTFTGETGQLDARVYDVTPEGKQVMISRGAYRIDLPEDEPSGDLRLPLFGNHYHLQPGHRLRLDLTQLDAPFLRPSNVPSSITFGPPTLTLPTRSAGAVKADGERTNAADTGTSG